MPADQSLPLRPRFAIVFLSIMSLYPISLLVLLFNRPTLLGANRRSPFLLIVGTLILSFVLIAGVVVTDPMSIAYFAAYGAALSILAWTAASWGSGVRWAWWIAEHGLKWPVAAKWCVRMIKYARTGRDIVIFVKGDEVRAIAIDGFGRSEETLNATRRNLQINQLFRRILYVEKNEDTSHITLVHFYGGGGSAAGPATIDEKASRTSAQADTASMPALDRNARRRHSDAGARSGGPSASAAIPSELEANVMRKFRSS